MAVQDTTTIVYADEVARILNRSVDTIRYWQRMGTVLPKSYKLGRRRHWLRSEIEALIAA